MPARRRDPVSVPRTFHSSGRHQHDYGIDESISRAGLFSNAVLEDTDYAAARSRGKDYDLLRNTNSAIIATETHSTPRAAVASLRSRATSVPPRVQARPARLQQQLNNRPARPKVVGAPQVEPTVIYLSTPPVACNPYAMPVVSSEVPWRMRAGSVEPRGVRAGSLPPPRPRSYHPGIYEPVVSPAPLGTEGLRAHRSPPVVLRTRAGSVPPPQRPQSYHFGVAEPSRKQSLGTEGLRAHRPPVVSRMNRAQSVSRLNRAPMEFDDDIIVSRPVTRSNAAEKKRAGQRWPSSRAASEPPVMGRPSETYPRIVDVQPVGRRLFARRGIVESPSVYLPPPTGPYRRAAIIGSKMESDDSGKKKRKLRPVYDLDKSRESSQSAIYSNSPLESGSLQSSRPPLPKTTDRKAIRTVDGFSKPKNVMSWEHRLDARVSPDDLLYTPSRFGRMRDQIRGAQEKMDRHKQLLDRYLDTDTNPSSSYNSRDKTHSTSPAGTDPSNPPMSDLRRRLRRTLAKTKNN